MVDMVSYELMLKDFNEFLECLPDDNDFLLECAVELKSRFIDLFGDN